MRTEEKRQDRTYQFYIEEDQKGTRIDLVLSLLLPEISRSFIQKLFEKGLVQVDGRPCVSKKYKVRAGEQVQLCLPEPEILSVEPEDIPLDIVYEDEDVMVVNKPRGMVVHPAAGNYRGTLVNAIMFHCGDRLSSINGVVRPASFHASTRIQRASDDRQERHGPRIPVKAAGGPFYHPAVSGSGLRQHQRRGRHGGRAHRPGSEEPAAAGGDGPAARRHAVTHYIVLERLGRHTLIEARLETGRTHQIRVHMAYIHHPLVGDPVYGPRRDGKADGQMLHAKVLGFVHPRTGEYMEFDSPLPEYFVQRLDKLRAKD